MQNTSAHVFWMLGPCITTTEHKVSETNTNISESLIWIVLDCYYYYHPFEKVDCIET